MDFNDNKNDDDILLDEEFEYHDGLGDLLKEKKSAHFSWSKTILSLVGILVVVGLAFVLLFNIGKNLMIETPEPKFGEVSEEKPPTSAEKPLVKNISPKIQPADIGAPTTKPLPKPKPAPSQKPSGPIIIPPNDVSVYRVIVGAFYERGPATQLVRDLKSQGQSSYVWAFTSDGKTIYRVQVGAFKSAKAATRMSDKMKAKGYDTSIIKK